MIKVQKVPPLAGLFSRRSSHCDSEPVVPGHKRVCFGISNNERESDEHQTEEGQYEGKEKDEGCHDCSGYLHPSSMRISTISKPNLNLSRGSSRNC